MVKIYVASLMFMSDSAQFDRRVLMVGTFSDPSYFHGVKKCYGTRMFISESLRTTHQTPHSTTSHPSTTHFNIIISIRHRYHKHRFVISPTTFQDTLVICPQTPVDDFTQVRQAQIRHNNRHTFFGALWQGLMLTATQIDSLDSA